MQEKTIRLLYPQWQGGDIAHWFADMPKEALKLKQMLHKAITL